MNNTTPIHRTETELNDEEIIENEVNQIKDNEDDQIVDANLSPNHRQYNDSEMEHVQLDPFEDQIDQEN